MSYSFSVKIVDEDGEPKSGVEVSVSYMGILSGFEDKYTDEDGWVTFHKGDNVLGGRDVGVDKLYVNGELVKDDFYPEDGDTMSFTI